MKQARPRYHIGFVVDFGNAHVSTCLMTVVGYEKRDGQWCVEFYNEKLGIGSFVPISKLK